MDAAARDMVRQRAGGRCEYCHFPDHALDLPFHVDHIVAIVHGRDDDPSNLAWACRRCNLGKGPNLTTIDPASVERVDLFNPRTMVWSEQFAVSDGQVVGLTACGRGTVRLLDMNNDQRVQHRFVLIANGEFDVD
ncbi:MAG: HNH endonuclease signature motif containing protein [Pirellulales bacterium]